MSRLQRPRSDVDGRGRHTRHPQQITTDEPADDIDKRIQDPHLMEMHLILGHTVGMPFRLSQSIEHGSALLLDLVRESTRGEDGMDPRKRERLAQSCRDHDVHFRGMDRPSLHPPLPEREP